jgi:hypothetical protein
MPVPSKRVKEDTEGTVGHHASLTHPALQEITIRWRGGFGYLAAWAGPGDDTDEEIRLCRIEYLGDDDWALALYDPATETYEPQVLPGGMPFGSGSPRPSGSGFYPVSRVNRGRGRRRRNRPSR